MLVYWNQLYNIYNNFFIFHVLYRFYFLEKFLKTDKANFRISKDLKTEDQFPPKEQRKIREILTSSGHLK